MVPKRDFFFPLRCFNTIQFFSLLLLPSINAQGITEALLEMEKDFPIFPRRLCAHSHSRRPTTLAESHQIELHHHNLLYHSSSSHSIHWIFSVFPTYLCSDILIDIWSECLTFSPLHHECATREREEPSEFSGFPDFSLLSLSHEAMRVRFGESRSLCKPSMLMLLNVEIWEHYHSTTWWWSLSFMWMHFRSTLNLECVCHLKLLKNQSIM